ncbi:MAG: hypothetical protein VX966_10665 [Chloroflexota bacterium]|nr:hypothetical protein [Chloroflexota bacterium]
MPLICLTKEFYDLLVEKATPGELIEDTIKRLLGVESMARSSVSSGRFHLWGTPIFKTAILEACYYIESYRFQSHTNTLITKAWLHRHIEIKLKKYALGDLEVSRETEGKRWTVRFANALRELVKLECLYRERTGNITHYKLTSRGQEIARVHKIGNDLKRGEVIIADTNDICVELWNVPSELVGSRTYKRYKAQRDTISDTTGAVGGKYDPTNSGYIR